MIEVEGALLRLQEQFQKVSTTPTEMYPSIYVHTYPSPSPAPCEVEMLLPSPDIALEMNFEFDVAGVGSFAGPFPKHFNFLCGQRVRDFVRGRGLWVGCAGVPGFRGSGVPGSRWTWGSLIVFSRLRSVRFMRLGMPTRSPGRAIKSYKLKLHAYVATSTSNYPTAGVKDTVPNRDRTSLHIP